MKKTSIFASVKNLIRLYLHSCVFLRKMCAIPFRKAEDIKKGSREVSLFCLIRRLYGKLDSDLSKQAGAEDADQRKCHTFKQS